MLGSHKKRNIAIIAIIILVVSTIFVYQFTILTEPPRFIYGIDDSIYRFYPNSTNAINLTCSNTGYNEANFYLVLKITNASFSSQTESPYLQINSTTVKFLFSLQRGPTSVRSVFFSTDEGTEEFSFHLSFEKARQSTMSGQSIVYHVGYKWNETVKCYVRSDIWGSTT